MKRNNRMPNLFIVFLTVYIMIFLLEVYFQFNLHRLLKPAFYENTLLCLDIPKETGHHTHNGYGLAPHKKIVIAGLCRNASAYIEKNLQIASMIGSYFKDHRIVIYENDSLDNTREILQRYAQEDPHIIVLGKDEGTEDMYKIGSLHPVRFEKMAYFRNKYLSYIRQHLDDYDYMMVIDWDMNGSTDINGIMNSIGREDDWGAIGTSGKMHPHGTFGMMAINYDVLAVRFHHVRYWETSQWKNVLFNLFYQEYHRLFYRDLEPVLSTFHGIVIYKMSAIPKGSWYSTEYGCEHIGFNSRIRNVYINPHWKSYFGIQGPKWTRAINNISNKY